MSDLSRMIFDDLIILFFGGNTEGILRDGYLLTLRDAFPENEVCDEIHETMERLSCGCCSVSVYRPANYIGVEK